ncbi:IS110 family transposase [Pedobacter changchengzhani]|uniref:IS110 family transposase n=1 Tax=Pedobacter changchengzhani TaxID=2529274 RepID=A0A4R5MI43_9SPHI|nr:IS110 family transposase [Pedobacter changchengzhani]TDG34765.1 IS110 family transposase [Pedobacter changchengzhani]
MNYELFVGIDISKLTIDAVSFTEEKIEEAVHRVFKNSYDGFGEMLEWLTAYNVPLEKALFCCEHTGIYINPITGFMDANNLSLWVENGLHIKRSIGIRRGKSDKADALAIAHYAYSNQYKARLYNFPSSTTSRLKHLLSHREQLLRHQTSLKCTCSELRGFGTENAAYCITDSEEMLAIYAERIKKVDMELSSVIQNDQELNNQFQLVQSVHGIGKQTAFFILIHTEAFSAFSDYRKFASYFGIAPFPYSSGTSVRGRNRVSSLANKKLKSLLTMCALNTIKKDNEFKRYYDRKKAEGKSSLCVLNVIKNKLLSRAFATIKRGTPYLAEMIA